MLYNTTMPKDTFLIVDGFSLMFRAFYSFPPTLTQANGTPINAAFGFISLLFKSIDQFQPTYLCICFDRPEPTFRKELFPEYKAHRPPPPDDFKVQVPILQSIIQELKLPFIDFKGYEADDLIGTLANKASEHPIHTYLLTSDQDCFQLVTEDVSVAITKKGVSSLVSYTPTEVQSKLGILPHQVVDYKALRGDSSDNIPGVKGVGEKTAVRLLQEYGSLDNIYQHLNKISSKSLHEKLTSNKENAYLSQKLARIDCKVPITQSIDTFRYTPNWEETLTIFKNHQFNNLLKKYESKATISHTEKNEHITSYQFHLITTKKELQAIFPLLKSGFAIDIETTSKYAITAQIVGISLCYDKESAYYIPLNESLTPVPDNEPIPLFSSLSEPSQTTLFNSHPLLKLLKPLLEDPEIPKITHHGKYEYVVFKNYQITLQGISFDTMLAAYILFPGNPVGLKTLAQQHLNIDMIAYNDITKQGKTQINFSEVPIETAKDYAGSDALCTWKLYQLFSPLITEKKLDTLFQDIELPTQIVLAQMESTGVCIDQAYLQQLSLDLKEKLSTLTESIHLISGESFNINSTKQLSHILYDKLNLPVLKKTKTGRSTDSSVLEKLSKEFEIAQKLLEYRHIEKLLNTYIDALPKLITTHTQRIHTQFNQTIAITGRLSSSHPNLQNIPIRTQNGQKVRHAFISSTAQNQLISIDYSQIELRLMAHLSQDTAMITAFNNGEDIHSATAAIINHIPLSEVTKEMRYHAKAVNFGIIYGISAYGLSENLMISPKEAKEIIDNYFTMFPNIKTFIENTIQFAKDNRYVATEFGRIRPIPEINSSNFTQRSFAQRAAVNTRVQGTAADIMKLAMVKVQSLLEEQYQTKIIIQVHDELVLDAPKSELDTVIPIISGAMKTITTLSVPLDVDVEVGPNWGTLKSWNK